MKSQIPQRVLIVEPVLDNDVSFGGHTFTWLLEIATSYYQHGFEVICITSMGFNPLVETPRITFLPILKLQTIKVPSIFKRFKIIQLIKQLIQMVMSGYSNCEIINEVLYNTRPVLVLQISTRIPDLLMWSRVKLNGAKLRLFIHWFPSKLGLLVSWIFAKTIIKSLRNKADYRLCIFTQEKELILRRIGFKDSEILNVPPICPSILISHFLSQDKERKQKQLISLSFVGVQRYDKGIDILVKIVPHLLEKAQIKIQTYVMNDKNDTRVDNAIRILKEIQIHNNNLELIDYSLPPSEYFRLIEESDIILLPYRKRYYKCTDRNTQINTSKLSGVLLDALLFGKVVVAPSDSILEETINKYGCGVLFKSDDENSLLLAIQTAMDNLPRLAKEAREAGGILRESTGGNAVYEIIQGTE